MPVARRRLLLALPTLVALPALVAPPAPPPPSAPPPPRRERDYSAGVPAPARAPHGMVATSSAPATEVGVEVLRRGGNAVDAAVAVALALAVTYPIAGNLGGGGFMLIRTAQGECVALDFRETAPAAARRDLYLDAAGNVVAGASMVGHRAVAVPGSVAGLALALERYGTRRWADLVRPARRLAERGFVVSHAFARSLRAAPALERFPESRRIFLRDGDPYREGERFRQPELADTLRRLEAHGPREFYEGRTAERIVAEMRRNGGLVSREDLRRYRPVLRTPLRGRYRGYEIVTMPPPSSGGVALLQMLAILERYPLANTGPHASATLHLLVEAMRRAFADRAEWMGDPDFQRLPIAGLLSRRYADERARSIDPVRATPSDRLAAGDPLPHESEQTTHFTVVDRWGNAVACTTTLNGNYGSGVTVAGAGFLLNNEMDDFTARPGVPNLFGLLQSERNAIEPGKRPLSSMTPTFVLDDGRLFLALGSPGGPTIIATVLQVLLNVVDHGMNLQQAVNAPRIHHQWMPDEIRAEPYGLPRDVEVALQARGHRIAARRSPMGDVEAVMIEPGTGVRLGASDPRNPDARAAGH